MDDSERLAVVARAPVRVVEALERVAHDAQRELERQRDLLLRAAAEQRVEVEPLDVLHRDVELVALAPEVEHLDDVRVVEARRELRLVDEHVGELRVQRELGEDLLDHAEPRRAEVGVGAREEDLGHAAPADEVEERVAPELARQEARRIERGLGFAGGHADAAHTHSRTARSWSSREGGCEASEGAGDG